MSGNKNPLFKIYSLTISFHTYSTNYYKLHKAQQCVCTFEVCCIGCSVPQVSSTPVEPLAFAPWPRKNKRYWLAAFIYILPIAFVLLVLRLKYDLLDLFLAYLFHRTNDQMRHASISKVEEH